MRYLITGAGQIGTQLAQDLERDGHEVIVLRRGGKGAEASAFDTRFGDAGDRETVRSAAEGASAIFHCIHAPYSASAWRRELPHREAAVMDVAASLGIPVIFPESVYAFGLGARLLSDDTPVSPVSPLGQVRAELLAARAAHPARTASVIASDLVGPTARHGAAVIPSTVLDPARAGRTAWVLGDPDAPHAVTYIPDLSRAMIAAVSLATAADTRLIAPTAPARSQRQMAQDAASAAGAPAPKVASIPGVLFALTGLVSPTTRELSRQRYLWEAPSELLPGRLTIELGLEPTPWDALLATAHAPAHSTR